MRRFILEFALDDENDSTPEQILNDLQMELGCCWNYIDVGSIKLTELPKKHGRLIDADALPKKDINLANVPYNWIKVAPTIVEPSDINAEILGE